MRGIQEAMEKPEPTSGPSEPRSTSAGVAWLTLAKFYFMGTGLVLVLILPTLFKKYGGDQHVEMYGDFRTVISLVNWFNMVLIGGTLQAVSKFISEDPTRARAVKWTSLKLQTVIGGSLALLLFVGADTIAETFYDAPNLAAYLRMAAPIVLVYAYYAVIIGALNGLKRFRHQALMDMSFATLKVALTLGLVAAGFAIYGAIAGFLLTSVVLLVVSTAVLGRLQKGPGVALRTLFAFEWKTLVFAFFLNGVLQIDIQLLKAKAPLIMGDTSAQTGIYGAMQQISQIPYVVTIAVAFVVFPLVSHSTFHKDTQRTRQYVKTTNRYVMLFLAGIVLAVAHEATGIVDFVYPAEYLSGAPVLAMLSVAYLFLAGMVLNANILTSSGRPSASMLLFGATLLIAVGAGLFWIPRLGLYGAALATLTALAIGFLGAAAMTKRFFGTFVPPLTLLRLLTAAAVVTSVAWFLWPPGTGLLGVILRGGSLFMLYLAILTVLGELPLKEWKSLVLLGKRK